MAGAGKSTLSSKTGLPLIHLDLFFWEPGWVAPEEDKWREKQRAEGKGTDLLPRLYGSPRWNLASAQMVASRHRMIWHVFDSDKRHPFIRDVSCPILVLYGDQEEVDENRHQRLKNHAPAPESMTIQVIEGAGHEYTDREDAAAEVISTWINGLAQ